MKLSLRNKLLMTAAIGLMAVALPACSDTDISSPGSDTPAPPPPPPPPPPPAASDIDFVPAAGCPTGSTEETLDGATTIDVCVLTGEILADVVIPAGVTIALDGPVFIGDGTTAASITFEPGARAFGSSGGDFLNITPGSQIIADGSPSAPVILTSRADLEAEEAGAPRAAGNQFQGEWGGLVINGLAPINACEDGTATGGTAECQKSGEGASGLFGGDDAADDSGTLEYVVVKYAGFEINGEDELNGIAFQGVGNGTDVDFIQVHNNADDGVEFFGGTVNAKHVVVTGQSDDAIDWTDGWVGNIQYAVVKIDERGERGIEADNNGDNNDAEPRSNPTIANFTLIGAGATTSDADSTGAVLKEGTAGRLVNGVIVNFLNAGIDIDDDATFTNAAATAGCSTIVADEDLALASILLDNTANIEGDDAPEDEATLIGECSDIVETTNSLNDVFPGAAELAVAATDASAIDAFFDATDYIGAFDPAETATTSWASGWTFDLFENEEPAAECPAPSIATGDSVGGKDVCRLTGEIVADAQLVDDFIYELSGPVFIGQDGGADATLTIDAGVTVYGQAGSDFIVVTRGSQLRALGTEGFPVVMTSRSDLDLIDAGTPRDPATDNTQGEWGGLVINGLAPINACEDGTATGGSAECEKSGEGASGLFGGDDAADNSGVLNYVRVQYAGFEINGEDELNGIAFQGVGSGTEVDFIQVHNNADDGLEWFGGTVDVKHAIVTGQSDDAFDWTDGWSGSLQFGIVAIDERGERGIEADNNGDDNDALPRSNPTISNVTLIGAGASTSDADSTGIMLKEGTAGRVVNAIVVNWLNAGVDIDDDATFTNAAATAGCSLDEADEDLALASILFDNTVAVEGDDAPEDEASLVGSCTDIDTVSPNTLGGFGFYPGEAFDIGVVPGATEQAAAAVDPVTINPVLVSAPYIGAVEDASDDWFRGWILQDQ